MKPARAIGWWLTAWAVMLLLTVMIGGITRLTDSGLSITEWKPISGVIPPIGAAAWEEAFAKYRQIPEYLIEHPGMDLGRFKQIYLWEYFHRLWARLVGLALLVPMALFWRRGWFDGRLKRRTVLLAVLLIAQGVLGWFMVQSGLTVRTDVSQHRLAAHLGLALVIVAITVATATRLLIPADTVGARGPGRVAAWAWVGAVFLTALAGAVVAGLDAGRIFNEFPRMGGQWVPPGYGRLSPWWANLLDDPVAAQFHHRWLATVTAFSGLWLGYAAMRGDAAIDRRLGLGVVATIVLQFALGVATLLWSVPVVLGVAHQGVAVAVFALAVVLASRRDPSRPARHPLAAVPVPRR
ncbi:MAG: heme A synthase [Gemmatimonadetes bacterium]|nr:heme A synthase [Gemmatimonadota bacterium]